MIYRKSSDGGFPFGEAQVLSADDDSPQRGAITAFQINVYIVWSAILLSQEFNLDITFRSIDLVAFEEARNLSDNIGASSNPDISTTTLAQDNTYETWMDKSPGNFDILFRSSTNAGVTFSNDQNLSDGEGSSFASSIAVR